MNPPSLRSFKTLARALAPHAHALNLAFRERPQPLQETFERFKKQAYRSFSFEEFIDGLAQILVYSAFLVRLDSRESVTWNRFEAETQKAFPVTHAFFQSYEEQRLVLQEALDVLNSRDLERLLTKLPTPHALYFYEPFLAAYDEVSKKRGGTFYTPLPVVHFMVRGLQTLLAREFELAGGLAHPGVQVLDFATGTGTYLHEAFEQVLNQDCPEEVYAHLLQDFFGFEYMMAPYLIAKSRLALKPSTTEPQIFLTDTLKSTLTAQEIPQAFLPL